MKHLKIGLGQLDIPFDPQPGTLVNDISLTRREIEIVAMYHGGKIK
jgi:hypothetical protein